MTPTIPRFTEGVLLRVWEQEKINLKGKFLEHLEEPDFLARVIRAAFPGQAERILDESTLIDIVQAIFEATRGVKPTAPEATPADGTADKSGSTGA